MDFEKQVLTILNRVSGVTYPEDWLIDWFGGGTTSTAGTPVTVSTALSIPGVYASVQLIGGDIATTPAEVRRELPDGASELVPNHPVAKLLNETPRDDVQHGYAFKESIMSHALLGGNGRAAIVRDGFDVPRKLILLPLDNTSTRMWQGEKYHITYLDPHYYNELDIYRSAAASGGTFEYRIPDRNVLHIMNMTTNGIMGNSFVRIMRDILGLDIAGRDASGSSYRNNGRPGLIIEAPDGSLRTQKEGDEYITHWNQNYSGANNANKAALLKNGFKASVLPMSEADKAFLNSREFSRDDILLAFGTQHILGDPAAIYKDLESRVSAYLQNTLSKWLERWEIETWTKLLSDSQQRRYKITFNTDMLIRTSPTSLAAYTSSMRTQGIMSGNEARRLHGMNPAPGLDTFENPNTAPAPTDGDESGDDETDETENETDQINARLEKAATRHFAVLIQHEIDNLTDNAGKTPKAFKAWQTKFYKAFSDRLTRECEAMEIPRAVAQAYVAESKDRIADCQAGDDFAAAIRSDTTTWLERAKDFLQCLI